MFYARKIQNYGDPSIFNIPYPLQQTINWRDVSVYIYRVCKGKRLGHGLARSCAGCMAAIQDKGIKKIYYTTDDGFAMEELY